MCPSLRFIRLKRALTHQEAWPIKKEKYRFLFSA